MRSSSGDQDPDGYSTADEDGFLGRKRWAIAEGYIPGWSNGPEPQFTSHETACLLNTTDEEAHVEFTVYFADREPAGPYTVTVPARRTRHVRFNELADPEPIPTDTDYASVISSDVPIVVQHTRLDSRQAENALLSTIAYASNQ
ncbi:sensory rhodopsin transducer [soil metagenome]